MNPELERLTTRMANVEWNIAQSDIKLESIRQFVPMMWARIQALEAKGKEVELPQLPLEKQRDALVSAIKESNELLDALKEQYGATERALNQAEVRLSDINLELQRNRPKNL